MLTFVEIRAQNPRGDVRKRPGTTRLAATGGPAELGGRGSDSGAAGEPWAAFRDRRRDWGRDLALYLGRQHCQLKLHQLGELAGGIEYTTVAMAVRRFEKLLARDKKLAAQTKTAKAQLCKLKI